MREYFFWFHVALLPLVCSPLGLRRRVVVALDRGAPVEDLRVALGDAFMQGHERGFHVERWPRLQLEMVIGVAATDQRCAVFTGNLPHVGRDVADRETDATVIGGIGRRPVYQPNVMQRHLTRL